jgi:elongation factor Ts
MTDQPIEGAEGGDEQTTVGAEQVRKLREITGAGMMDCKRALQEAGGDFDRAQEILRTRGLASAEKRSSRVANEGVVEAYIHMQGRLGVLVEVNCETDFVANTPEFRSLARDVAMHVAALNPRWITREEVPEDVVASERKIYEEQARSQGKPENVLDRIVDGKLESFFTDRVLYDQPFVKDDAKKPKTVGELVGEVAAKLGEKVAVRRFARFKLGEEQG